MLNYCKPMQPPLSKGSKTLGEFSIECDAGIFIAVWFQPTVQKQKKSNEALAEKE
jgi:hypothetical protein